MAQLRERIRYLHYSLRTEEAYLHWVRFFIHFHGLRHPRDMGKPEIEAFLSMLATERKVSVSTHRQALERAAVSLQGGAAARSCPGSSEIGRPLYKRRIPVRADDRRGAAHAGVHGRRSRPARAPALRHGHAPDGGPVACASRTSTSIAAPSSCAKARAPRTVSSCCPARWIEPLREQLARSRSVVGGRPRRAASRRRRCPTRWSASTRAPASRGPGTGLFPAPELVRRSAHRRRATASPVRRAAVARPQARRARPASTSTSPPTPCATPSPPTCCRPAPTSAPCRSCWATATSAPP